MECSGEDIDVDAQMGLRSLATLVELGSLGRSGCMVCGR